MKDVSIKIPLLASEWKAEKKENYVYELNHKEKYRKCLPRICLRPED
jgi:hypothetical protein